MLKGKINQQGLLSIERAGQMKIQYCPYHPAGLECGDWCPKFNEPHQVSGAQTNIAICGDIVLQFHTLTDNRESDDVEESTDEPIIVIRRERVI